MSSVYLFRIDGAKDNDAFFDAGRATACIVYAGADFRAGGCGWIPDFVRVIVGESGDTPRLTLIELEATESVAIISCRKYLPENSDRIVHAFLEYLDRVIRLCRSSADARETDFAKLKGLLQHSRQIAVSTAGALRSSESFVEELPLMDQPNLTAHRPFVQPEKDQKTRIFSGGLRLSQKEAKGLVRCVKILDAVIRHCDHSGGTIHSWVGGRTQPLKRLLSEDNGRYPALGALLFERDNRGITCDFEKVLAELINVWSAARGKQLDLEGTRSLVSRYFPLALQIGPRDQMAAIFDTARALVADAAV